MIPAAVSGPASLIVLAALVIVAFVLPGVAWNFALWPASARLGWWERLALIPTTSYLLTGTVALALARIGHLRTAELLFTLAVLVAAGVVLSIRSARRYGRPRVASVSRTTRLSILVVMTTLGLVLLVQATVTLPTGIPIGTTTWYYWGLTRQLAELAAIPATSPEWGGTHEYQGDYILFNAFSSVLPVLAGRSIDFAFMEALRLAGLLWGMLAALAAFRRFLPREGALLAALMFFAAIHVVAKYTGYRPESFNYALIFFAVWAVDRFRERQSPSRAIPVIAAVVALWIGHGVVLVVAGLIAGGMLVGWWIVDRPPTRGELVGYASVVMAGVLASGAVDLVLQGKVLLLDNITDPGRIQAEYTTDLTWQFQQWVRGVRPLLAEDAADSDALFVRRIWEPWAVVDGAARWVAYGLALAPVLLWRWMPKASRALWVGGWVFLAGLFLVVLALLTMYDTYVPQRVGFGRLSPFTLLGGAVLLAVSLSAVVMSAGALASWLRTRWRGTRSSPSAHHGRRVRGAMWSVVIALVLAVACQSMIEGTSSQSGKQLSADGLAALTWLREETPADSIVLANSYTEGSIGTIGRRNGLLDGRAPYNKAFTFLLEAVRLLRVGRSFYQGETDAAALGALGVDYVVVSPKDYGLANDHPFCDPIAEVSPRRRCFSRDPGHRAGLTEVAVFGDVVIYAVDAGDSK